MTSYQFETSGDYHNTKDVSILIAFIRLSLFSHTQTLKRRFREPSMILDTKIYIFYSFINEQDVTITTVIYIIYYYRIYCPHIIGLEVQFDASMFISTSVF